MRSHETTCTISYEPIHQATVTLPCGICSLKNEGKPEINDPAGGWVRVSRLRDVADDVQEAGAQAAQGWNNPRFLVLPGSESTITEITE